MTLRHDAVVNPTQVASEQVSPIAISAVQSCVPKFPEMAFEFRDTALPFYLHLGSLLLMVRKPLRYLFSDL
uniref:Transposase n=1 Tax=Steinernema glaseri TaxID=37863 RepID=A0A1I7ZZG7_9BILA